MIPTNTYFLYDSKSYYSMQFKKKFFYKTPLCFAVQNENIEIIKLLLSRDDINIDEKNLIPRNKRFVDHQQQQKNEIIKINKTALYIAAENGNLEIIKLLLEKKGGDFESEYQISI